MDTNPKRRSATVAASWFKSIPKFKSPLRVVVAILLRSRANQAARLEALKVRHRQLAEEFATQATALEREREKIRNLLAELRRREAERQAASRQVVLPDDPPLASHGYGANMVCLSINLAQRVGLRGAVAAMKIAFASIGIECKIPNYTAIRNWMQRYGVAQMQEPVEPADDWIWMLDHSNQIGPEKVLHVLGIRASQLPPPGEAIRHEHVRTLLLLPGVTWKTANMDEVYRELAARLGAPRAVLVDGAAELREGAHCLTELRPDSLVLRDFKHFAANAFKALIGSNLRFLMFASAAGRTRSAIQQTELAHHTPPTVKQKARFMNLKALLHWAVVRLWLLGDSAAQSNQFQTRARLEEKLGWLRPFEKEIAEWDECQAVISAGVTFVNEQGLFRGAARGMRAAMPVAVQHPAGRRMAARLIQFVRAAEKELKPGERLPLSTEILESSFGLYKQLEGQHSKGGFTGLVAALPGLLGPTTPESVRRAFERVSVKQMREWVKEKLGSTLASKRTDTHREYKAHRSATKSTAAG